MAMTVNDGNFEPEILKFQGIAIVDFWATWCGPCRIQGPIVDSLAEKFSKETKLKITKMDIDENNTTAMQYKILSIPTLAVFKNGELLETLVGLRSEAELEEKINNYLEN